VHETPQDEALVTYAPKLVKTEGQIDWSMPSGRIHNLVRGLWPSPHAFTHLSGMRYIVHRSRVSHQSANDAAAGTILLASPNDGLHVACGDGTALEVIDLQLEGKRVMSARDLMASKTLVAGARFGTP
jgi:methionyl-tRNA formyltransferase